MSTAEHPECPRCGAPMPKTSSKRFCAACLLSGAIEPSGPDQETVPLAPGELIPVSPSRASTAPTSPRAPAEPTEFPCEFGEYRLAARVNHPNSLYIFGSEEIEGLPVITMEIAGSGTLKDQLKRQGPFPVSEAVDAILDVIAGLESAFTVGVLHRDIKPSNCFVSPEGSVKVGDLGLSVSTLARTDSFVTAHGKILGTPAYASPEQLRGDALDLRADIYSVGATLFTLLTDRAPFEGNNAVQVVANAVNQKPKPLNELRADVPPALARVVTRCLAKEPEGRYSDYQGLRLALLPFSSREPEPASMKVRTLTGWIDYLIAFLVPYVVLMLAVGARQFHLQPLFERSLHSARYHFAFLAFGFLYFACALGSLLLCTGAAVQAALHPHRGWHDGLAGTWVVRR